MDDGCRKTARYDGVYSQRKQYDDREYAALFRTEDSRDYNRRRQGEYDYDRLSDETEPGIFEESADHVRIVSYPRTRPTRTLALRRINPSELMPTPV